MAVSFARRRLVRTWRVQGRRRAEIFAALSSGWREEPADFNCQQTLVISRESARRRKHRIEFRLKIDDKSDLQTMIGNELIANEFLKIFKPLTQVYLKVLFIFEIVFLSNKASSAAPAVQHHHNDAAEHTMSVSV